jgi:hypothetical protein
LEIPSKTRLFIPLCLQKAPVIPRLYSNFFALLASMTHSLENQFIYPIPKGSKLIFFAPLGAGVNEENQWARLILVISSSEARDLQVFNSISYENFQA